MMYIEAVRVCMRINPTAHWHTQTTANRRKIMDIHEGTQQGMPERTTDCPYTPAGEELPEVQEFGEKERNELHSRAAC
jgi:hypothetical protein